MTIRVPKNPDDLLPSHVEKAIDHALTLFARYEDKVDLSWSNERIDRLYRPYQLAREQAVELAHSVNWMTGAANGLP